MKYRFAVVVTKEDNWYVGRCPELGVTSQGKDAESARTNLREAIELYLETWGAPLGITYFRRASRDRLSNQRRLVGR
jgi:predicted RNase H-like HicB family nuclease